jgi:hypothetical protein
MASYMARRPLAVAGWTEILQHKHDYMSVVCDVGSTPRPGLRTYSHM